MSKSSAADNKPFFNINLKYSLEGEDLVVTAPIGEMEWKPNYPLTGLTILPMFGGNEVEDTC